MKCPIIRAHQLLEGKNIDLGQAECLKKECAWWSKEKKQCDPTGMLPWFRDLCDLFTDIRDKMPRSDQFLK